MIQTRTSSILYNVDEYQLHLVDLALVEYNIDKVYDFDLPDIENQELRTNQN
jgi:hypothetical protein